VTATGPDEPSHTGIGQLLRVLGTVVAPTGAATALLYYFGFQHAFWFFDYFGVNSTMLGLGTGDYLLRAVDVLLIPLTGITVGVLVALAGHRLLTARIRSRLAAPALACVATPLALTGLLSLIRPTFLSPHLLFAPVALGTGTLALAYALHLYRTLATPAGRATAAQTGRGAATGTPAGDAPTTQAQTPGGSATPASEGTAGRPPVAAGAAAGPAEPGGPATDPAPPTAQPEAAPAPAVPTSAMTGAAEWAIVLALVGVSLFWAANDYAAAVGRTRAGEVAAELPGYPSAAVYSEHSLSITAPGVREVRCHDPEAAYRFRYDGLKLMLQSGDQYVLLTEHWTPQDGVAVVLPRGDSIRLEFSPASAAPRPDAC